MNLTDLKLVDAFIQVNLVKGYRYLDTAGQIMNDLDDRFTEMQVGLQGLTVTAPSDPEDHLTELRVSGEQIWLHFGVATPWTEIRQEAPRLIDRMASVMSVGGLKRRGLRTMLLYPVDDLEAANRLILERAYNPEVIRWSRFADTFPAAFRTQVGLKHVRASVTIRPVRILSGKPVEGVVEEHDLVMPEKIAEKLPQSALLIDSDIYDSTKSSDTALKPFLNHATDVLEDEIVPLLSRIVGQERQ